VKIIALALRKQDHALIYFVPKADIQAILIIVFNTSITFCMFTRLRKFKSRQ